MFNVLNDTASEVSPLHKIWSEICSTWAVGLTVIVKVSDGPSQLIPLFVYVGVTVMFETIDANEVFTDANDGIFPSPLAANPIFVLSFVQEYVVTPSVFSVTKTISSVISSSQYTKSVIDSTWAVGLTVIVNVSDSPVLLTPPLSNVGVTTMFATCVWFDEFRTVNAETVPFPLAAKPIDVLSFVQE